jgi:hypothetical protein
VRRRDQVAAERFLHRVLDGDGRCRTSSIGPQGLNNRYLRAWGVEPVDKAGKKAAFLDS